MAEPVDDHLIGQPRHLRPPGPRSHGDGYGRRFDGRQPGEPRTLETERDGDRGWGVVESVGYRDKRGDWDFTTFWVDDVRFETQDAASHHVEWWQAEDEKQLERERVALAYDGEDL